MGCMFFGLELKVYMVKISYNQKPYRRILMETWGATCVASPSKDTNFGRTMLEQDPDSPGSLGMAISEAVEDAGTHDDTRYSLGSVLNHVLLHNTVNGLETKKLMEEQADTYPDIIVGCVGGGSNFAGMFLPFARDNKEIISVSLFITPSVSFDLKSSRTVERYSAYMEVMNLDIQE